MDKKVTLETVAKTLDSVAKSVDDLAAITAKGFEAVHKEIAQVRTELKGDIAGVKEEVEEINERLEKYYSPEFENHGRRIKILETYAGVHKEK